MDQNRSSESYELIVVETVLGASRQEGSPLTFRDRREVCDGARQLVTRRETSHCKSDFFDLSDAKFQPFSFLRLRDLKGVFAPKAHNSTFQFF